MQRLPGAPWISDTGDRDDLQPGSQMIQQMSSDDYQVVELAVMAEVKTSSRVHQPDGARSGGVPQPGTRRPISSSPHPAGLCWTSVWRLDMQLEVSDAALLELAKAGFDPVFGAGPSSGRSRARGKPAGQAHPQRASFAPV